MGGLVGAGEGTGVGTWIGVGLIPTGDHYFLFNNIIYNFEFIISNFLRRVCSPHLFM